MSGYLVNFFVTVLAAIAVFAAWVANRKRIAAETVGRAEEQALRIAKEAERGKQAYTLSGSQGDPQNFCGIMR
jgi:hypothetical protein